MKPEKVVGSLLNLFSSSDDIPWHDKRWYIHHKTIQLARIFFVKNILLFIIWMDIHVMLSYTNKNKVMKRLFCRFLPDIINLRKIILVLSNYNRVERTFIKITTIHYKNPIFIWASAINPISFSCVSNCNNDRFKNNFSIPPLPQFSHLI